MPTSHIVLRHNSFRLVTQEAERRAGHADYHERAHLLADIRLEAERRELSSPQVHDACGLQAGTLGDCSLSTETLHAALRHVRSLPRAFAECLCG